MAESPEPEAHEHQFEEVEPGRTQTGGHLELPDLMGVKLRLTAELGSCKMLVRDILELKNGSVVHLNKMAGEMTDILVNGLPMAKGEVVVIGDTLHVRIAEIPGTSELGDEHTGET